MLPLIRQIILLFFACALPFLLQAQQTGRRPLLQVADTLDPTRLWLGAGGTAIAYSAASIGLWQAWYQEYELTGFHTFNDFDEWEQMDKIGHTFTTYVESYLAYKGARWTGLDRKRSIWLGAGVGMLFQTTIEVMDGFSAKWGFSWGDMAFNTLGATLFVGQELAWQEQRIWMKVSSTRQVYPETPLFQSLDGGTTISPRRRALDLFGSSLAESLLKDYNAQTLWLSVNLASAFGAGEKSRFPSWLNLAIGYGAANMYSGSPYAWTDDQGAVFQIDPGLFPRYRQFYLSPDIDLSRIRTRSRFLKMVLTGLNWIKIPAPALEINTRGGVIFRPIFW